MAAEVRIARQRPHHGVEGEDRTQAVTPNDDLFGLSAGRFSGNPFRKLLQPRLEVGSLPVDVIEQQDPVVQRLVNSPAPAWPLKTNKKQPEAANNGQGDLRAGGQPVRLARKKAAHHDTAPRSTASASGASANRRYRWFAMA